MEPVSRNSECPCGSKRRFKDCHGAIAADYRSKASADPGSAPRSAPSKLRSSYRPTGPDWAHLSQVERAECGALMERGLKRQMAGRLDEAIEAYSMVLARAPDTHDALHMLGAIHLRRNDLPEARRLIEAAMKLRAPYPKIEHNFQMLQDMEQAERAAGARAQRFTDEICERALPSLVDLALRPASSSPREQQGRSDRDARHDTQAIHIIAGVRASSDNGDWLVTRLADLLALDQPTVWTVDRERYAAAYGTRARDLAPDVARYPRGGCHVFVGVDLECAEWIRDADADRVVVFCQPAPPSQYLDQLRAIARDGARTIDLIFPSLAMASRFGAGHAVLPPPIAFETNRSDRSEDAELAPERLTGLTVGVVGRNWPLASMSTEGQFLKDVAAIAGKVELYDPGQLRYVVGGDAAVHARARGEGNLPRFLDSAHVVLHAAGKWWLEGDGRELFAAMAAGVPVLCPRSSIYAEYIEHGVDGLLYEARDEAVQQLAELRRAPARTLALGRAARAKITQLVESERMGWAVRALLFGRHPPAGSGRAEPVRRAAAAS